MDRATKTMGALERPRAKSVAREAEVQWSGQPWRRGCRRGQWDTWGRTWGKRKRKREVQQFAEARAWAEVKARLAEALGEARAQTADDRQHPRSSLSLGTTTPVPVKG